MKRRSCGVFWNIAPLYSRSLWYELSKNNEIEYTFYSGSKGFSGIRTIDHNESVNISREGKLKWYFLKNIVVSNILFYQIGIVEKCVTTNHDAYVLPGEMHTFSNWLAAFVCRIRKKPLFFWGHGLYGNEKGIKKNLRITYYRLADFNFVYSNRSRELLIRSGFNPEKVIAVYNSLDYTGQFELFKKADNNTLLRLKADLFPLKPELPIVIFIGRLTIEKKIHFLIEAIRMCKEKGHHYNCLIVGAGNESDRLKNLVVKSGLEDQVLFYGASYNDEMNAQLLMLADCTVSPGNVGLTAIHSLTFGTPVITHDNFFNQGPEVEAVIPDKTGLLFVENNVESLSAAIDDLILHGKKLVMSHYCIEEIKQKWNPSNQARIISNALVNFNKSDA